GDEVGGAEDGAVDVALGGEVHHRVHARHGGGDLGGVADVALDDPQPRGVEHRGEVGQRPGVGQQVQHDDLAVGERRVDAGQGSADEVGADETGAAGDQYAHDRPLSRR